MVKNILIGMLGFLLFLTGGASVGVPMYFIMNKKIKEIQCPEQKVKEQISVTTISGKPGTIQHSDWNFKGKNKTICFKTESTGKAETKTTINKDLIPEAHKWMTYHHGLQPSYTFLFIDNKFNSIFGIDYLYRYEMVGIGAGPRLSYYNDKVKGKVFGGGASIMGQIWFKGL